MRQGPTLGPNWGTRRKPTPAHKAPIRILDLNIIFVNQLYVTDLRLRLSNTVL